MINYIAHKLSDVKLIFKWEDQRETICNKNRIVL